MERQVVTKLSRGGTSGTITVGASMKLLSIAALILAFVPVPQVSTGTIEGIVTRKDSRTALPGVRIAIEEGFPSRTLRTPFSTETLTDGSGRFTVHNIPAGEFDITASLQDYLRPAHARIVVRAGQRTQVALELTSGSTIRGRITDSENHPVSSARVQVLQQYTDELGQRQWRPPKGGDGTNDNGEYRIPALPSGSYYVRTVRDNPPVAPDREPDGIRESVYFPGTADPNVAASIAVGEGAEVIADIRMPARVEAPAFKVSGKLLNSAFDVGGVWVAGVSLLRRDRMPLQDTSISGSVDEATGRFEILNVPPGAYDLLATIGLAVSRNRYRSRVPIDVRDQDIEDLAVSVSPGADVKAHIVVDGDRQEFVFSGTPASVPVGDDALRRRGATNIRVRLNGKDFRYDPDWTVSQSGTELTFTNVIDGTYKVTADIERGDVLLNPDFYVHDVRVAGRSVYDSGIRVGLDPVDSVEIVIGTRGGAIEGTIPRKGKTGAIVVLIPDSFRRSNSGLYKREAVSVADEKGQFRIRGIAPGNYKIFAVPDTGESLPYRSPEFAVRYESRAVPVTVQKGATAGVIQIPLLEN